MSYSNFPGEEENAPRQISRAAMQANIGAAVAWGILILAIAITIGVWDQAKHSIEDLAYERFQSRTEEIKTQIKQRLHAYELVLRGAVSVFSASEEVTRSEWATYIADLGIKENYPGIQGIGFAKKISRGELQIHTEAMRLQGFSKYTVWPQSDREEYTSIVFLEPFDWRNQRAFGYDMSTDATRRAAMHRARDTGMPSMSGKVTLVQETDQDRQFGFLMYIPVYKKAMPYNTVEQRRAALMGYVYSPFRMNDFMTATLGNMAADVQVEVFDTKKMSPETLLFKSIAPASSEKDLFKFKSATTVMVNGRAWTLQFQSLPALSRALDVGKPAILLTIGLLISFLLFAVVWTLATTRRRAIEIAQDMILEINESRAQLREITSALGEGLYVINAQGIITFANPAAQRLLGWTIQEMQQQDAHQLIHRCKSKLSLDEYTCPLHSDVLAGQSIIRDNEDFCRKDGSVIPVEVIATPIIRQGGIEGAVVAFHDISARKRAESELRESERFKILFEYASDALFLLGENGRILDVNRVAIESLKYSREELLNLSPEDLLQMEGQQNIKFQWPEIIASVGENKNLRLNLEVPRKGGERFLAEITLSAIDYDQRWLALMTMRDITERKKSEESLKRALWELEQAKEQTEEANRRLAESNFRLQTLSQQDALTGIGNRRYFDACLEKEWRRAVRFEHSIALIFADVDHFKAYNDSYGHQAGDECLKQVAAALNSVISRPSDILVRYGGEEFVLLLPDTTLDGACQFAEQLRTTIMNLKIPHNRSSAGSYVTISLGVAAALASKEAKPEELIHFADKALYEAKKHGRNRVCCTYYEHHRIKNMPALQDTND